MLFTFCFSPNTSLGHSQSAREVASWATCSRRMLQKIKALQKIRKKQNLGLARKLKMDFNVQQSIEFEKNFNGIRYRETRRSIRYMNCRTTLTKREIGEDWIITISLMTFSNMETEEDKLVFQQLWNHFFMNVREN